MAERILCFGELLIRLAAPGRERLLQSPRLEVCIGGAEANVAVSLAGFGHEAAMLSVVADNALGHAAIGELRRHGVDTRLVDVAPGRMGLYFLETGAVQRPSSVLYDRADSAFARAGADRYDWSKALAGASWLHLSGVTPALGVAGAQAALAAATAARASGVRVCFDGNFRAKLWQQWGGDPGSILRELMAQTDLIFADHRDIAVALGGEIFAEPFHASLSQAATRAFDAFPHLQRLVCTQREQRDVDHHVLSAWSFHRDGTRGHAAPRELAGIVDRIGAGDAFAAGFLHGLCSGMDDARSLDFALAAACLKHSIPGDFNPVSVEEVEALLGGGGFHVRR
ncbi:sugar kinase [Lysobacter gummosus]|uniref:Sugar kinase n=1 Tax=Lysobacter gummosus TaxID=262324 RepID=A0ABY3X8W6_9GAMM|nr:sugar kinase [Lysobacter gummosus]ALN93552.1 pfkB carbohydrate kinase family protein [Lysobacter gummosus]UNP28999.1 sugar kinase [Lysobacter gummosus]